MRTLSIIIGSCLFSLMSALSAHAADNGLLHRAQAIFRPVPEAPPPLAGNPSTPEKLHLGKILFFDPRLSSSGLISCNTCHNLGIGGVDFQETSVGHKWQKGPRNAPTVLNSVFNVAQFWDGRAVDLAEQAKGPVQASVEMSSTPERVLETLKSMPRYVSLFKKSFPEEKEPVTFENMVKAVAVFEATLITPHAPFDEYLGGNEDVLTVSQKEGLRLFLDKGCGSCHGGINMGGSAYFPFGVIAKPADEIMAGDKGRYKVTGVRSDEYMFKSPSLRNIALTPPYFHSGKVWELREAVAVMGNAQLGITLNEQETERIEAFLAATTGRQPAVSYPILPESTDSTPKPKLD